MVKWDGLLDQWSRRWETDTRYYETLVLPDLFGQWVLLKQWGGKGSRLGGTRVVAVGLEAIAQTLDLIEKQRARAGYSRVCPDRKPRRSAISDTFFELDHWA